MGVIRPAHCFLYLHWPQERKERKTHASFFLFTATFSCLLKSNVSLDLGPNLIPGGSDRKEPACTVGDPASIPVSGRFPGEGHGNRVQYCCLENPMDRGAWQAVVRGVRQEWVTNTFTSLFRMISISISLTTKTLFQNNVTFMGSGWPYLLGGTVWPTGAKQKGWHLPWRVALR